MKQVKLKIGKKVRWSANWSSLMKFNWQCITVDTEVRSQITIFTLTRNNPYATSR